MKLIPVRKEAGTLLCRHIAQIDPAKEEHDAFTQI